MNGPYDEGTSGPYDPHGAADSGTGESDDGSCGGTSRPPRIPPQRTATDDADDGAGASTGEREGERPVPARNTGQPAHERPPFDHQVLKSLLGAWALAACSAEETAAVEAHLSECAACASEALRLRDAVGLLHPEDSLDLDPMLRTRVLERCLVHRPPRVPVPEWATPYDAEAARLDALLRDMAAAEWTAPVWLRWFDGQRQAERQTTVAGVIAHLLAVDGLLAGVLGLPDPLTAASDTPDADDQGDQADPDDPAGGDGSSTAGSHATGRSPEACTEDYWRSTHKAAGLLRSPRVREPWREQSHAMIRTVSFAGRGVAELDVGYGDFTLPLKDAFLDRAFECWIHAEDIAGAIDYPYSAPAGAHMHRMVDLAARQLPGVLARRRRTGLAGPPQRLATAGTPGRALHLEVEGEGGGDWYIPLDSPGATASPGDTVAHVALDGYEFCQLAAGHLPPQDAAAGLDGDREAIRDVLYAAASLSRM